MAFDFEALLSSPQFQTGLALLGNASPRNQPLLNAFTAIQGMQRQKQEAEERKAMMAYRESQAKMAEERTRHFGKQVELQELNIKQQREAIDEARNIYRDFLSGGIPGAASVQPSAPALPAPTPAPSVGKYGTPLFVLDNLEQVESGGNPLALGPVLPNGKRAKGAYQFQDETKSMLESQGFPKFNVFDRNQSRDAADFYIQDLLKKNGGDMSKALADYGGFKTKDPSGYVGRVMAGSPEKQAVQGKQMQLDAAAQQRRAALEQSIQKSMALQAASGMLDFKNPAAGLSGLSKSIMDAQQARVGLEQGEAKLGFEERRVSATEAGVGLEKKRLELQEEADERAAAKEKRLAETDEQKKAAARAVDYGQVQGTLDAAMRDTSAVTALKNHPGLARITGRWSAIPEALRTQLDPEAANAKADLDSVGSKILLSTITALKALSENGSTGFGQLSNIEGEHLVNSVASLKQSQTYDQIKERLGIVQQNINRVMDRAMDVYEKTHSQSPFAGLPVGTRPYRDKNGDPKFAKDGKPLLRLPDGKLMKVEE